MQISELGLDSSLPEGDTWLMKMTYVPPKVPSRSEMTDEGCPYRGCDGKGVTEEGATCLCVKARQFRSWVGDNIFAAEKLRESPLIDPSQGRNDSLSSMWITATWADFLAQLRFVTLQWFSSWSKDESHMQMNNLPWKFRLTTDHDLLKGSVESGRGSTVESEDAILASASLLIVRVGMASTNKTLPEMLTRCIQRRVEIISRPMWIVDSPSSPLRKGHPAWSSELEEYLGRHFGHYSFEREPVSSLEDV